MFLSNGVTTVRNMWGSPVIDAFAAEIRSSDVAGPFIYSTGPITDGNPPAWFSSRVVETAAEAEAAVKADKRDGYVAIKVYSLLSSNAYAAIVTAARKEGLPVVGHVPRSVGLEGAIAARQDSIEHLDEFLPSLQPGGRPAQRKPFADALAKWIRAGYLPLRATLPQQESGFVRPSLSQTFPAPTLFGGKQPASYLRLCSTGTRACTRLLRRALSRGVRGEPAK